MTAEPILPYGTLYTPYGVGEVVHAQYDEDATLKSVTVKIPGKRKRFVIVHDDSYEVHSVQ
jgi:hypothetical protein